MSGQVHFSAVVGNAATRADVPKNVMDEHVRAFIDQLSQVLIEGGKVNIPGFGSFQARTAAAREARNPQTGGTVQVPEKQLPKFSASSLLVEKMNPELAK